MISNPQNTRVPSVRALDGAGRRMRNFLLCVIVALPVPAVAQTIVAGDVRIDATGVHIGRSPTARDEVQRRNGGSRTIAGNGIVSMADCRGGTLTVAGNHNSVTAIECSSITVAGSQNRVRWHRARGVTKVTNVGVGNHVSRY